jgi:hypothetical protein
VLKHATGSLSFILMPVLMEATMVAGTPPLPRVGVRDGRFVAEGKEFRPRGFNYVRLRPTWHGTFSPKRYEATRAEAMLADLEAHGFNIVRVFIDHDAGEGVVAARDATELSPAFMANVLDFLGRALRHRVYVVPSLIHLPQCKRYSDMLGEPPANVGGANVFYLSQGHIDSKARYVADFAAAVRKHDPGLLTTVFAYELDNETHLQATAPPFSLAAGAATPANGKTYDLSSEDDLQRMADDNVARWANACAEAIRKADPAAMVSTNVFTFRAIGRSGPGRLRRDQSKDRRFPARPLALAETSLDYLDIHFYPFDDQTLDRDLASIEFEQLKTACAKRGKPLVMGEFGAFKGPYKTLPEAAAAMTRHVRRVADLGFAGYIYWTYDCDEQAFLWNAKSGRGEIFQALAEMHR